MNARKLCVLLACLVPCTAFATVSDPNSSVLYNGDDATLAFAYSFPTTATSELVVRIMTESTGALGSALTLNSNYTATASSSGGTVTMAIAPASTEKLLIERVTPKTQTLSLTPGGAFNPTLLVAAYDKLTKLIIEAHNSLQFAVRTTASEPNASMVLPPMPGRAIKYFVWDANGNPSTSSDTGIIDAQVEAFADLTGAANKLPYFTGVDSMDVTDFTSAGRALLDDAAATNQRTTLGLAIGTNVQAYDPNLTAFAGLAGTANTAPYFTGPGAISTYATTSYSRGLMTNSDANNLRPDLELGVINVKDYPYLAKGDGVSGTDGNSIASNATFSSATAHWVSGDIGKTISIAGVGAAGATLTTTIASRNSATSVELTVVPSTTVAGTADYIYGTDDTIAIVAAINACPSGGTVLIPAGIFLVTDTLHRDVLTPWNIMGMGLNSVIAPAINASTDCIYMGNSAAGLSGGSVDNLVIASPPPNTCLNAIHIERVYNGYIKDVTIACGHANAGILLSGATIFRVVRPVMGGISTGAMYTRGVNGIVLEDSTVQNNNVFCDDVSITLMSGVGFLATSSLAANNIRLSGVIQSCGGRSIDITGMSVIGIQDFYTEACDPPLFTTCSEVSMRRVKAYASGDKVSMVGCTNFSISDSWVYGFTLDADSYNLDLQNCRIYGGRTAIAGAGKDRVTYGSGNNSNVGVLNNPTLAGQMDTRGAINWFANADFRSWGASGPTGWQVPAGLTWTRCGSGLADTNSIFGQDCAKAETTGYTSITYTIPYNSQCLKDMIAAGRGAVGWWVRTNVVNAGQYPWIRVRVHDAVGNNDTGSTVYNSGLDVWEHAGATFLVSSTTESISVTVFGNGTFYIAAPTLTSSNFVERTFMPSWGEFQAVSAASVTVSNGATSAGYVDLYEDSDNGVNYVRLIGPASSGTATLTLPIDTEIAETGYLYNTAGTLTTVASVGHSLDASDGDPANAVHIGADGTMTTAYGRIRKVSTPTNTYDILVTDDIVVFEKTTPFTATLPVAVVGQTFVLKNKGAGNVTITPQGADTFDGVDEDIILTQYDSITLVCDVANSWVKL
jgi:hypothetical protein